MKRLLRTGALVLLAAAAVSTAASAATFKIVEAGAPFPNRSFVLAPAQGVRLASRAVHVSENGRPVAGLTVLPADAAGVARFGTVLVLDASNSMRGRPLVDAVAAARAFADRYGVDEQPLAILAFNRTSRLVLPLTPGKAALDAALKRPPALGEGTHIYDALGTAINVLQKARISAGSIVLLSDGADTGSSATLADVVARASAAHVRVFSVGLRSPAYSAAPLQELASELGGVYSETGSSSQLASIFDALGKQISNQYLVTYLSAAGPRERVRVTVSVHGLGVSTREYVSPPLPAFGTRPFHRSFAYRFWHSTYSMVLVAVLVSLLVAFAVMTLLRQPRSQNLRRRMGEFVSIAQAHPEVRQEARIPQAVFAGAEKGLARTPWWDRFQDELEIAEVRTPAVQIVLWTLVGTIVAIWLLATVMDGIFAVFGLFVPLIARGLLKHKLNRKRDAFADQLPENLQVLASALRSGHSFVGALSVVVDESAEPSKSEFRRVVVDEQLGVPLDSSLDEVARRMDNIDLEQVALVAALQRRTGSNSAEIIDRVAETIRGRFELRRLARTLTAQGRLSRWILTFLPVGLLVLITLLNPGYIHPLLHTGFGHVLLVVCSMMVIAGSLIIKRIVEIKV